MLHVCYCNGLLLIHTVFCLSSYWQFVASSVRHYDTTIWIDGQSVALLDRFIRFDFSFLFSSSNNYRLSIFEHQRNWSICKAFKFLKKLWCPSSKNLVFYFYPQFSWIQCFLFNWFMHVFKLPFSPKDNCFSTPYRYHKEPTISLFAVMQG